MIDFVRRARSAAALLAFAFAATAAPAIAADGATAATATVEAASSPGLDSLQDVVERAIAVPAAVEAGKTAPTILAPTVTPSTATVRPLAELVAQYSSDQPRDAQADCLASAVYFESNGEPLAGQLAVAEVIINRARSGRFASTLCGVITQRSQFSFVRGGRIPAPPRSSAAWRTSVAIAHIALDDVADSPVSTALFFHARYVSPHWRLQRLAAVGNHIFYR